MVQLMGHYQEEGIGVKGLTSDRGSIPKESPRDPMMKFFVTGHIDQKP